MITEVTFEHYRCFETLHLSDLRRVNVIVGQNGRGKTAFLEGLFMLCGGSPELYFRTRAWRGLGAEIKIKSSTKFNEALFLNLFSQHYGKMPITLKMLDQSLGHRNLRIYFPEQEIVTLPLDGLEKSEQGGASSFPIFEWQSHTGNHVSSIQVQGDAIKMPTASDIYSVIFQSPMTASMPAETAKRFSDVSKKGELQPVLQEVQSIYPEIKELSLEFEGDTSMIHASCEFSNQKIPLQLISSGITKYLSLLLSILASQNGMVLIDEIENGFFFSKLPDVWKSLLRQSRQQNAQMFVSTHSWEFLRALEPSLKENADDYSLLRAESIDGAITMRQITGKHMLAAIKQGMELR